MHCTYGSEYGIQGTNRAPRVPLIRFGARELNDKTNKGAGRNMCKIFPRERLINDQQAVLCFGWCSSLFCQMFVLRGCVNARTHVIPLVRKNRFNSDKKEMRQFAFQCYT